MTSLSDPYGSPELRIRRPGSDETEIVSTAGDDPYQTEMNHFIDAVCIRTHLPITGQKLMFDRLKADLNHLSFPHTKTLLKRTK